MQKAERSGLAIVGIAGDAPLLDNVKTPRRIPWVLPRMSSSIRWRGQIASATYIGRSSSAPQSLRNSAPLGLE
jgi:hypothetical protein